MRAIEKNKLRKLEVIKWHQITHPKTVKYFSNY
jgi:hypothetical protein